MKFQVGLFNHHPECSNQCCQGIVNALSSNYDITIFGKDQITPQFLKKIDMIIFPGGLGDADKYYELFPRKKANLIADFVEHGGYYLGICMGAYWAGHYYFDILDGIKCYQYIYRPRTEIRRSYSTVADVNWQGVNEQMFFYDGCSLIGDESKFEVVARYNNNDPAAVIQGRIGLIGPHPESEKSWYKKPYQYISSYWHEGRHHNLLLNFVDKLTQR